MIIRHFQMNKITFFQVCLLASLALGFFAFTARADGMDAKPGAPSTETNLTPVEAPAPLSVFDTSLPYKDPFFPNSTRKKVQTVVTNVVNRGDPSLYQLKGISGVQGQEVVIINNRNAAAGERVDVALPNGATSWITVLKIEQHSATIKPDGEPEAIIISLPKSDW